MLKHNNLAVHQLDLATAPAGNSGGGCCAGGDGGGGTCCERIAIACSASWLASEQCPCCTVGTALAAVGCLSPPNDHTALLEKTLLSLT